MFLQNLSLSDDNRYVSNNVLIGSDVTNEQQEGPVSIRSGSTLINSHNGVFIKNNFTVLRGAEFKITN